MSKYPNSAIMFKNDKKGNDKAPDLKGSGEFDGVEVDIAAWIRQGNKGEFYSVKFSKKGEFKKQEPKPKQEDLNDEIPW